MNDSCVTSSASSRLAHSLRASMKARSQWRPEKSPDPAGAPSATCATSARSVASHVRPGRVLTISMLHTVPRLSSVCQRLVQHGILAAMNEPDGRWRIKEFADIVGVPEATLRAWERRYALLRPERTAGNFRLYTRADERRIRSMQAHMARGMAPAQAASLALSESEVQVVPPARPAILVEALILAAEAFDATRFDALLDAAFAFGQLTAIRDVVLPTLVEIGTRWERAAMSVCHEHFASHIIERRLLGLAKGWEAGRGPLALLACPSG